MACGIATARATAKGSISQVVLQGGDSEKCPAVGMQGRQAAGKLLFGVLLQTQQLQLTLGGRAALLSLQVLSQQAQLASQRLHCGSSAERSGPVR